MSMRRVWAIPLASRGFVPVDPERNPVRWYLEDYDTGKVIDTLPHETREACEAMAARFGFELVRGIE